MTPAWELYLPTHLNWLHPYHPPPCNHPKGPLEHHIRPYSPYDARCIIALVNQQELAIVRHICVPCAKYEFVPPAPPEYIQRTSTDAKKVHIYHFTVGAKLQEDLKLGSLKKQSLPQVPCFHCTQIHKYNVHPPRINTGLKDCNQKVVRDQ